MDADEREQTRKMTDIDRTIHEPARYNIMALLYVIDSADFLFVERQTGLTPGNLSSHLAKLEAAQYIAVAKDFVDRRPRTMLKLTEAGRAAFREYSRRMKQLFDAQNV